MYLSSEYTTTLPLSDTSTLLTLPGSLFFEYESKEVLKILSLSANVWYRVLIKFPLLSYPRPCREDFIGILTDDEAMKMKEGINLFKKRFDHDLARRKKILFGE